MSFSGGDHFTVHGRIGDRSVSISYDRGRLSGDDDAVAEVTQVVEERTTLRLDAPGQDHPARLDDPYAVMGAIQQVVDIERVDGDYPIAEADDSAP